MGWIADVGSRIRELFVRDKERVALQMAKGFTGSAPPVSGYDLLQAYGYDILSDFLRLEQDLMSRFVDYEEMDDYPEISSAIDIFADDSTIPDTSINRTIWVTSTDKTLQQNLDDLFHRTLRLDEDIWEIARTLVKYGNDYEELLVTEEGVRGLNFLPAPTMRRIEGYNGELFGFVQDFKGKFGYSADDFKRILAIRASKDSSRVVDSGGDKIAAMEDWEVVHFRMRGRQRKSVYGFSVLESARWIWKRLMLLEDSALIYRLQRAPERYAFYVDVGDLPPAEALAYLNKVRQQFKKKKFFDPSTGKLSLKYEPLSSDEDFFIPVRKGVEGTRVEVLGSPSWQHMDDIEYFRDKLFSAIKIPKAYLGQEEGIARGVLCLTGDTKVHLLNGETLSMKELSEKYSESDIFYVYSCDTSGKVVPGEAKFCRITRPNAEIWEVVLDDGTQIRGTADHPFLMRDGTYKDLSLLKEGDSLMSLFLDRVSEQEHERCSKKVLNSSFVGREDCYDFRVEEHHNFAIATNDGNGIFVHNSSEDVRFARTVLRVQRELRNGFGKVARVHLAALNINPEKSVYDIRMTVPSAIFELAQLEARNARADLAGRMREFVSLHWILSKVFSLSDTEISDIMKQRGQDAVRDAAATAEGEAAAMKITSAGEPEFEEEEGFESEEESIQRKPVSLLESRVITRKRRNGYYGPISEQELFSGNRESEKRAEEKLDKLMKNDKRTTARLMELRGLLHDLRLSR